MSARFPHIATPDTKGIMTTFHFPPEPILAICWERGYSTKLVEPDLNSRTMQIEIGATRQEIRACWGEDQRRVWEAERLKFDPGSGREETFQDGRPFKFTVRCYFETDTIADVLREHGLTGKIVSFPSWCFRIVQVTCMRPAFRAAQFEWIKRLSINHPKPIPAP